MFNLKEGGPLVKLSAFISCINVVLALMIAATGNCRADIIVLRDGSEHEGEIVGETRHTITVQKRMGGISGSVEIAKAEIVGIQVKSLAPDLVSQQGLALQKEAESAVGESVKIAEAWVRVGEFYARHAGYSAKARQAFEKALVFDENQPAARGKLGFIKENGRWIEAPKPKNVVEADVPKAAVQREAADEVIIGLRRDDAMVKKIIDDQAARQRVEAENDRRLQEISDNSSFNSYGYTRDYYIVGSNGAAYYYSPYEQCYIPVNTGNSYYHRQLRSSYRHSGYYGGNNGYYGGFGGYGFGSSSSYSSSGFGVGFGFSGRIGNVHVNGAVNSGGFRGSGFGVRGFGGGGAVSGFNSGVMRYGF
jgi:hypothetical protein